MQYQKFVKEFWGLINMFLELRFPLLLTGLRETKIKVDQQPLIMFTKDGAINVEGGVGVASFPAFTHVRIDFVGVPP